MAIFTSHRGYYEITELSFSPGVITLNDATAFRFTVKNLTGKKITSLSVRMSLYFPLANDSGSIIGSSKTVAAYGTVMSREDISWAANASHTFTGTFKFEKAHTDYEFAPESRLVPLYKGSDAGYNDAKDARLGMLVNFVAVAGETPYNDIFHDVRGENSEYLAVINARYAPTIALFSGERTLNGAANDEGEALYTRFLLRGSNAMNAADMALKLHYEADASVAADSSYVDLSDSIQESLNSDSATGITVAPIFDKARNWNLMLVFGDAYESAVSYFTLSRAFANLHLSGYSTGGACFGGFCSSTPDNPKLESYFPGYFYNGIKKIGDGWQELTLVNGTTPATYGGGVLRYRKIEDKCIIAGSVEVKPTSGTLVLANLPEGFVPAYNVFSLNACSGGRVARIAAYSNEEANTADTRGKLVLTWVKDISDGDNYTSAAIWIQCSIEYWADSEDA